MTPTKATRKLTPASLQEARALVLAMQNLTGLLIRWQPGSVHGEILRQHLDAWDQALAREQTALAGRTSDVPAEGETVPPRLMAALLGEP